MITGLQQVGIKKLRIQKAVNRYNKAQQMLGFG